MMCYLAFRCSYLSTSIIRNKGIHELFNIQIHHACMKVTQQHVIASSVNTLFTWMHKIHGVPTLLPDLLHFSFSCLFFGEVFLYTVVEDGLDAPLQVALHCWFDIFFINTRHELSVERRPHDSLKHLLAQHATTNLKQLEGRRTEY